MSSSNIPFERYDEEFQSLTQQVQNSLQQSSESSKLEFTHSLLRQCDDLLKQMSIEARGVEEITTKQELLAQVQSCKLQLQQLQDQYEQQKHDSEKESLFSSTRASSSSNQQHKERLLKNEDALARQNESLERARRVMSDTEETALEITTELGRNRETLESAHGRVREVSSLTNRARRLLQSMSRRQVQQKLAVYAVGVAILIVVLMLIWSMF